MPFGGEGTENFITSEKGDCNYYLTLLGRVGFLVNSEFLNQCQILLVFIIIQYLHFLKH